MASNVDGTNEAFFLDFVDPGHNSKPGSCFRNSFIQPDKIVTYHARYNNLKIAVWT